MAAIIYNFGKHLENSIVDNSRKVVSKMTLREYLNFWLTKKQLEVKPSTYQNYAYLVNNIQKHKIVNKELAAITYEDYEQFITELVNEGKAKGTIKLHYTILRDAFTYAVEHGYAASNPCLRVKNLDKRVKKETKEVIAYTDEEQESLVRLLRAEPSTNNYMLEFLLETGLRIGEAMALRFDNIEKARKGAIINIEATKNVHNGEIGSPKTKTSKRRIPLSPRAKEIVETMRAAADDEYVFGANLDYDHLWQHLKNLCAAAHITYYGCHVLRHTFATNQYYKGTDVPIISKLLGHANTQITLNTYINLWNDGMDEMFAAVS